MIYANDRSVIMGMGYPLPSRLEDLGRVVSENDFSGFLSLSRTPLAALFAVN